MSSTNSRLAYAIANGGIATVITYMASAIWVDAPSHWLAAGAIVQGMGTLLTLILLVWQIFSFQGNREEDYLDQLLKNLTEKDSLKRLLSIRQLNKLRKMNDVRTYEFKEKLKLVRKQYAPPPAAPAM
jgi:hypothetical protein